MTRPYSVFDEIIKGENDLTQLLRNMLRFKIFRRLFLEHLDLGLETEHWDKDGFDVQYHTKTHGRPDLVMEGGNTLIFFEIKVYDTILTANQPEGYFNELVEAHGFARKVLILLAPRNYYDFNDYDTRLSNVKMERTNILTKIIYWEDIAELIVKNEIETASPIFHEFYKFLDRWFKLQINLTQEDMNIIFNKQFPVSLHKLTELIDGINDDFQKLGYQLKFQDLLPGKNMGIILQLRMKAQYFLEYGSITGKSMVNLSVYQWKNRRKNRKSRFEQALRKIKLKPVVEYDKCYTTHFDRSILELPESRKEIVEMIRGVVDEVGVLNSIKTTSGNVK